MITRQEIENIMGTFGLKPKESTEFICGDYSNLTLLMYDKGIGKAAVWMGDGFCNWLDLKSTIIALLTNTIVRLKKKHLDKKLESISNDFK